MTNNETMMIVLNSTMSVEDKAKMLIALQSATVETKPTKATKYSTKVQRYLDESNEALAATALAAVKWLESEGKLNRFNLLWLKGLKKHDGRTLMQSYDGMLENLSLEEIGDAIRFSLEESQSKSSAYQLLKLYNTGHVAAVSAD